MTRVPPSDEVMKEMHRDAGEDALHSMQALSLIMVMAFVVFFVIGVVLWRVYG